MRIFFIEKKHGCKEILIGVFYKMPVKPADEYLHIGIVPSNSKLQLARK